MLYIFRLDYLAVYYLFGWKVRKNTDDTKIRHNALLCQFAAWNEKADHAVTVYLWSGTIQFPEVRTIFSKPNEIISGLGVS